MKAFYNSIIAKFEHPDTIQKFTAKQIIEPKYIDLYAGQDQFEENFELFNQTALFVDWNIDHEQNPPMATVNFYCCYEQLRSTANISENRDKGLLFIDYCETINEVLEGTETEITGKLKLSNEGFNRMDSITDVYLLSYECSLKPRKNPLDNYQMGDYDKVAINGTMTVEFDDN